MSTVRADRQSPGTITLTQTHVVTVTSALVAFDDHEDEASEDEEIANYETLEHVTRDDVHEQRERCQNCEGVIHAPHRALRVDEPHGFDGTRSPRSR